MTTPDPIFSALVQPGDVDTVNKWPNLTEFLRTHPGEGDECFVCGGRCWVVKAHYRQAIPCPRCNPEANVPDCGPEEAA